MSGGYALRRARMARGRKAARAAPFRAIVDRMNAARPEKPSGTRRLGVLLAEDNEDLAEMLKASIEQEQDLYFVGRVDRVAALREQKLAGPVVVVLDLQLGGESSLPQLRALRASMPEAAFVIFSGHDHAPLVSAALAAGASRYVVKSEGLDALLNAVREAGRRLPATG
jgi:DNA-binding NarL/FixJ family response regulator